LKSAAEVKLLLLKLAEAADLLIPPVQLMNAEPRFRHFRITTFPWHATIASIRFV